MWRPLCALINLNSITNNLRLLKNKAPNCKLIAVVKADAYGHGLSNVIKALTEADSFAVSSLEEAIKLRKLTNKNIILLEGFFKSEELKLIEKYNFQPVLHSFEQFQYLTNNNFFRINFWLKVNTGMNRLGFTVEEITKIYKKFGYTLKRSINIIGLLTHFSCSDEPTHPLNQKQIETFRLIIKNNIPFSISNSAAILSGIASNEWIRPGIALYGVSPFNDNSIGTDLGLFPVMTLVSQLISTRFCSVGDTVGYGAEYICPENMLIGVIAVGYGDGYPRHAPMGTPVLINDTIVSLIGRVCMDMIIVDLRKCKNAKIGDQVVLWGRNLPIEIIAKYSNTIPHELLSGLTARVPRCIESH
jgi:alanine racemase